MKTTKFKVSEIGPIPEEWDVKRLGDVWSSFRTGPFGSALHAQDYVCNGTPLVNPMHIVNGSIVPSAEMGVDSVTADRLASYKLSVNDIVIGRRGEMGRAAIVHDRETGWLCGTGCFYFHLKEMVSSEFVVRYLRTPACVSVLEGEAVGTTLVNLNQTILGRVNIPVPPRAEQEKIAAALSDVDELLAAMTTLIEKKRAIKQGAMQELLEVRPTALTQRAQSTQRGAKNFEPCRNVERVEERTYTPRRRLAGFTGAWVEKRLGDCGEAIRGVSFKPEQSSLQQSDGKTMLLRSNNIQNDTLNFDDVLFVDNECVGETQLMRLGDILICAANGSRNLVGKSASLKNVERVTFGAFMAVFRPNGAVDAGLIGALLQTASYHRQLDDILTGSAINNLNAKDIENLTFAIPSSLAEQKAIAGVLADMDAEIAALEAKRAKYEQVKSGMMQELLTGKTRLEA